MRRNRWVAATVLAIAALTATGTPAAVALPQPPPVEMLPRAIQVALCADWDYTAAGLEAIEAAQKMAIAEMAKSPDEARREMTDTPKLTNETRRQSCVHPHDQQELVDVLWPTYAGKPQQVPNGWQAAYERAVCTDLPEVQKAGNAPAVDTEAGKVFASVWKYCDSRGLMS